MFSLTSIKVKQAHLFHRAVALALAGALLDSETMILPTHDFAAPRRVIS
jgi:hypothetical protein